MRYSSSSRTQRHLNLCPLDNGLRRWGRFKSSSLPSIPRCAGCRDDLKNTAYAGDGLVRSWWVLLPLRPRGAGSGMHCLHLGKLHCSSSMSMASQRDPNLKPLRPRAVRVEQVHVQRPILPPPGHEAPLQLDQNYPREADLGAWWQICRFVDGEMRWHGRLMPDHRPRDVASSSRGRYPHSRGGEGGGGISRWRRCPRAGSDQFLGPGRISATGLTPTRRRARCRK